MNTVSFRNDGKLIVTGSDDGRVKVFDVNSKASLRVFSGHTGPVRAAKFSSIKTHIVSAGHDKTIKHWDLVSQTLISTLTGHQDYIRDLCSSISTPNIWASGGYDHKIKLWDLRTNECINTLDQGCPIESIVAFPSGNLLLSAGENTIKVWDLLSGGKLVTSFSHHQKTITSLCLDHANSRLYSAGLDLHLKVYDIKDYTVKYSFMYSSPILSMAVSNDLGSIAVGTVDGTVALRSRVVRMQEQVQQKEKQELLRTGNYKLSIRNIDNIKEDYTVNVQKKVKLKEYDKYLKQFEYKNALDASMEFAFKDPVIVVSMLEELERRDALITAISGRDELTLKRFLEFLFENISDRRWNNTILNSVNHVLDIYSSTIGQSKIIDKLLIALQKKLSKEIEFQKEIFKLIGSLDSLLTSSTILDTGDSNNNNKRNANNNDNLIKTSSTYLFFIVYFSVSL